MKENYMNLREYFKQLIEKTKNNKETCRPVPKNKTKIPKNKTKRKIKKFPTKG